MEIGNGRRTHATGIGNIELDVEAENGRTQHTLLQDVYLVPGLDGNLLSISHLVRKGYEARFEERTCAITHDGSVALARRQQSLYVLRGQTCSSKGTLDIEDPSLRLNIKASLVAYMARMHVSERAEADMDKRANNSGRTGQQTRCIQLLGSSGRTAKLRNVTPDTDDSRVSSRTNSRAEDTGIKLFEKEKQPIEARDSSVNHKSIASDAVHVDEILQDDEGDPEDFSMGDVPPCELQQSSCAGKAPTWKKDINEEPTKVKKGALTFGTIQSGATGRLWHRDYTAVEGGISSDAIDNGDIIPDLLDSVGALSGRSARSGEEHCMGLMCTYHCRRKMADSTINTPSRSRTKHIEKRDQFICEKRSMTEFGWRTA